MEISLYDGRGYPVAYIAEDEDRAIYLWTGQAVAYLAGDNIFGWKGQHIGWFVDGVLYNRQGRKTGSIRKKCPAAAGAEPAKQPRETVSPRGRGYASSVRPVLRLAYADEGLAGFLKQGALAMV